ncbi:MAG: ABC-ATPase UvrA [Holophagales bacterium]|nr:ABC-ATPase UvrA [Holophagales bacterium]
MTEIDELLRLLFARAGSRPCPRCGREALAPACACGERLEPLWAADFSPHTERGACPACRGLGFSQGCDPSRLVNRPDLPLGGGALAGTRYGAYLGEADGQHLATLRAAACALGLGVDGPWSGLSPAARQLALEGAGDETFDVEWSYRRGKLSGVHRFRSRWDGLARLVETEYERVHADERGEELEPLLVDRPCVPCGGERLKPQSRAVSFAGLRAPEAARREAGVLAAWLDDVESGAGSTPVPAALLALTHPIRSDLKRRVKALCGAGLSYLAPERELSTLSGGEAQRVRLAAALGGGLVGVTYVLDEPTQGLHPRDTARLAALLRKLSDAGNAVVVVEHDAALVAAADHVVELGPGAGPDGGIVVASGRPSVLASDSNTYTGRLLVRTGPTAPAHRRALVPGVTIRGATRHTLKDLDVDFPSGGLVVVAGVSGSGKSTLVLEVLAPSLRAALRGGVPVGCRALDLHVPVAAVLASDQETLSVGGGSTVATLIGVAEPLRKLFAATPEARARKLTAKAFSSNTPGGRCEPCAGRGVVTVAMDLLPDVTVGCEACGGRRFSEDVLACRLYGRNLTETLDAPVGELAVRFAGRREFAAPLAALSEIGLPYLRLGQEGAALSSGERQRLRLARLLAGPHSGRTAVLLDEPTRGLGFEDVDRLLGALGRLAADGHLVVVVEHHPGVLAAADWLVELGPEGGARGGRIVRAEAP